MMLEARIRKRYGEFQLDTAFTAGSGAPLALLGASGSGKSVTLRCLAGIDTPDEGKSRWTGRPSLIAKKGSIYRRRSEKSDIYFSNTHFFPI